MSGQTSAIDGVLPGRGLPLVDLDNQPFFDAAARGELMIQRCVDTGRLQHYPRAGSIYTGGAVEWVRVSGHGTIHTFTVVRANASDPVFGGLVPYVVAIIDLAEGARMMGNVTGCDPADLRVSMPVEVYFTCVDIASGTHLPFWRPRR